MEPICMVKLLCKKICNRKFAKKKVAVMLRLAVGKPTWPEKTVYNVSIHKSDKTATPTHENELLKIRETNFDGLTLSWKREFACLLVVLEPGWLKSSANTMHSPATTCIAIEFILQNLHDFLYRFGPWEHIIFLHANIHFALVTFLANVPGLKCFIGRGQSLQLNIWLGSS